VIVSETLNKTAIGTIPVVGEIILTFCGTLVTGILSCSLLYFFDRSELVKKLVRFADSLSMEGDVRYFREQALYFEEYAAKIMKIDIDKFREEVSIYDNLVFELTNITSTLELNDLLLKTHEKIGIKIPWEDDFDSFMLDKNSVLIFE
jgi:hypothetical protein